MLTPKQAPGHGAKESVDAHVPSSRAALGFIPSQLEWLSLFVGLALIVRYRWVLDDSTVYFRYVDNLLFLHRGLVYNHGEFVEGFSSPLWVAVLVAFRATRLDYWTITLICACASWILFWLAAVRVNRCLGPQEKAPSVNVPLILLATAYAPLSYFSSGSESPLMQLSAACVALYAVNPSSALWRVLLGLLPLVRNEFAVPLIALIGYEYFATRRIPLLVIASAMVAGASWIGFRICYYADLFPCPFYLKDKVAVGQGIYYVMNGFRPYGIWLLLAFAALAIIRSARHGNGDTLVRRHGLMVVVAFSSLLYVVKVGGDMMHYRLIAFPFCLLALSAAGLFERFSLEFDVLRTRIPRVALGLAIGFISFLCYPSFLSMHPVFGKETRTLDHGISDAPWHRHHPELAFAPARRVEDALRRAQYARMTSTHSAVATEVFCATAFARASVRYVHGYGLTEPVLARVNAPEQRPGHKGDLVRLAVQLQRMRTWDPRTQPGVAAHAIARGLAPEWIVKNARTISLLEKRMYNQHRLLENLRLAVLDTGRIDP